MLFERKEFMSGSIIISYMIVSLDSFFNSLCIRLPIKYEMKNIFIDGGLKPLLNFTTC